MNWFARLHFLHRAWRYRLRSEKFGVSFLLSRDLTGKTAVDIGANWGIYSYWMHGLVGAEGHVIAFEPQPELLYPGGRRPRREGLATYLLRPSGAHSGPLHGGSADRGG